MTKTRPKNSHIWSRNEHDWYIEPESVTADLLRYERFFGPIWDPACGGGNVMKACKAAGYHALGTDLVRRVPADLALFFAGELDFLGDERPPFRVTAAIDIITNPPFFRARGTEDFIRKALSITRGKVAVFTDVRFLASQRRATGLFAEHCPHRVWILAKRPSCPPGEFLAAGNQASGGTADWCWLVWSKTEPPVSAYQGGWIRPAVESEKFDEFSA